MTTCRYYRPLVQTGACRPEGAMLLAGGPRWFTHAEELRRDRSRRVIAAAEIPDDRLAALTAARAPLAGLAMDRPRIMGILNVTPDSFSDGGNHNRPAQALAQAKQSGFFEGFEATPEMPLHAPDCFAHSNAQMPGSGYATLDIACDIRFDPWTGVELSPLEQAYYKKNVVLRIEGDAGPSGVIGGKELIVSGQNRATNASIRMVTTFRNKGN